MRPSTGGATPAPGEPGALLSPTRPFPGAVEEWAGWVVDGLREEEVFDELRRQTRTGQPLGEPGFVERLESLLGRVLRPGQARPETEDARRSETKKTKKGLSKIDRPGN